MAIPQYRPQRDYTRQIQPEIQQPTTPAGSPSKKVRKREWTKGEKIIFAGMITVIAVIAILSLSVQSKISTTSAKVDEANVKIATIQKENENLSNEVAEKSTYERFVKKAKELGLTPNADNIKAVSKE